MSVSVTENKKKKKKTTMIMIMILVMIMKKEDSKYCCLLITATENALWRRYVIQFLNQKKGKERKKIGF